MKLQTVHAPNSMNDPLKLLRVSYRKQNFRNDNFSDDNDAYFTITVNLNYVCYSIIALNWQNLKVYSYLLVLLG